MIRRCLRSEIPQLIQQFALAYPKNPRLQERDFIDWQFRDNPLNRSGEYLLFCSWEGSSINGFVGYLPVQVWYDGSRVDGCWIEVWHAERGAVGMGLLGEVMSLYDLRFMAGVTPEAATIYEAYKIPMVHPLPRWIGFIDPEAVASRFGVDGPGRELMFASSEALGTECDTSEIRPCVRFESTDEFRFDKRGEVKGFASRTGDYLNWRYFDIPRHNYRAIRGPDEQFAVYRVEKIKWHEESVLRILEWNFSGESVGGAVRTILEDGRQEGAILMDFFCTSGQVAKGLEGAGFFPSNSLAPMTVPYLFRPVHQADGIRVAVDAPPHRRERDLDFNEWYITKGDSDMDRIKG